MTTSLTNHPQKSILNLTPACFSLLKYMQCSSHHCGFSEELFIGTTTQRVCHFKHLCLWKKKDMVGSVQVSAANWLFLGETQS